MMGLYSTDTPARLFDRLELAMQAFYKAPSEDGIFEIIFPLYHLREWICPQGYASYRDKTVEDFSLEEKLHAELHSMPAYQLVRGLCNRAKHYSIAEKGPETSVLAGFRSGLGTAGDSLGVTHFIVDGQEIRRVFWPVYTVYRTYFRPPRKNLA